jgi:chromosome segregation protein
MSYEENININKMSYEENKRKILSSLEELIQQSISHQTDLNHILDLLSKLKVEISTKDKELLEKKDEIARITKKLQTSDPDKEKALREQKEQAEKDLLDLKREKDELTKKLKNIEIDSQDILSKVIANKTSGEQTSTKIKEVISSISSIPKKSDGGKKRRVSKSVKKKSLRRKSVKKRKSLKKSIRRKSVKKSIRRKKRSQKIKNLK